MKLKKFGILIGTVILSLTALSSAKADPVSFSNVVALTNGSPVDLASSPNILLNGLTINFSLDLHNAVGDDMLRLTFQESGQAAMVQTFDVPLFSGLPSEYSQLFNFQAVNPTFDGTPVTLTVALLTNSGAVLQSETFNFTITKPIPEPATACLFTLGLAGLLFRKKRR